jgi:sialate O-acetylesterase
MESHGRHQATTVRGEQPVQSRTWSVIALPWWRMWVAVYLVLSVAASDAGLTLAPVFSESMVLQRDRPIRLWGTAPPDRDVIVRLGERAVTAATAPNGTWQVRLRAMPAGGPHRLTISSGADTIHFVDVLLGDVWLASGQSNMAWPLRDARNGAQSVAAANHPQIRLLTIPRMAAYEPVADLKAIWQHCTPATVAGFSAIAYHFGRRLQQATDVPIGLINASYGGARIEPWIDESQLPALFDRLPDTARELVEQADTKRDSFRYHMDDLIKRWNAASRRILQAEEQALSATSFGIGAAEWPTLTTPMSWREALAETVNGLMWLRREIEIPSRWQGRDLALFLGPLDAVDVVWFGGQRIGNTGRFAAGGQLMVNKPRVYRVPGHLVRPGSTTVTIQKIRWVGMGRFYVPAPDSIIASGFWGTPGHPLAVAPINTSDIINLHGVWTYWQGTAIPTHPDRAHQLPTMLYNAMIHPLVPLAVKGVIWYQGEANVDDGAQYGPKLEALIQSWRRAFQSPDLRFYVVQIAPYRYNRPRAVPELWEAQQRVVEQTPHTGIVPTGDIGDLDDIHPRDKETVGDRLASLILHREHGVIARPSSGPVVDSVRFEAERAIVTFHHANGLHDLNGGTIAHFEIAGADGHFHAATARIVDGRIVLSSPMVTTPAIVHYAWDDTAQPDLVNDDGWPAWPFRYPTQRP